MLNTTIAKYAVAAMLYGLAYLAGRHDGAAITKGDLLDVAAQQELLDKKVQRAIADSLATLEVKHVTIKQQLETEVRKEPVYINCEHPDNVLRIINAQLTGANNPSNSSEVP